MKKLVLFFGLTIVISVAQSFSPKQDRRFTISLTEQEINICLEGLGKLPLERSQAVYSTILQQAQSQLAPTKPAQKADTLTNKKKP